MLDLLRRLFFETLTLPHIAARRLIGLDLPPMVPVIAVLLFLAIQGAVWGIVTLGEPQVQEMALATGETVSVERADPIELVSFLLLVTVLTIGLVYFVGRLWGGTGDFRTTVRVMAGLSCAALFLNSVLLVVIAVLPALGLLALLALVIWNLWAQSHFIKELHGFQSPLKVFGGILLTQFAVAFLLAILLVMAGVVVPEVA